MDSVEQKRARRYEGLPGIACAAACAASRRIPPCADRPARSSTGGIAPSEFSSASFLLRDQRRGLSLSLGSQRATARTDSRLTPRLTGQCPVANLSYDCLLRLCSGHLLDVAS